MWLNEASAVAMQQSLRHLQSAFVNFWEKKTGYPSFKKKKGKASAEFTRAAFRWDKGILSIAKVGILRIKWSRRFTGDPSTVMVSKTPSGRYYVTFRVDEPLASVPEATSAIGVDLGLIDFAATSTGSKYQSPRPLRRKMAQLKRAQKALSRKQKGSNNRTKARIRVAKVHEKIADIRQDFLHKLSTKLVRENQTIVIEDLNVRGMMANHKLAGAISDSGWSEFTRQLAYKCEWYGRRLVKIDHWFPSSKRCSKCGHVADSMPLNVRQWECLSCGAKHDRDVNAAINILAAGLAVTACGEGVRPPRSQERGSNPRRSRNRSVECA
jgi:putative transposase